MKYLSLFVVFSFFSFLYYSCSSTSYDLENVEEEPDTIHIASNSEIKQEVEQPKLEIIEEPSTLLKAENVKFTIQIGAYQFESNAMSVMNKAKALFNYDINYYYAGGLYKVRLGVFDSRADALTVLNKIQSTGFTDSFILKK